MRVLVPPHLDCPRQRAVKRLFLSAMRSMEGILFAVFVVFLCPATDIAVAVTEQREILQDGRDTSHVPDRSFPFSAFPSPPLNFTLPLLFPKELNKKLSYLRQNELSIIKTHDSNIVSQRTCTVFIRTSSRLAAGVMFSTCPSVCPFVRLSPTCECYVLKMNEPISVQIGTTGPWGYDMNGRRRCSGGQRSRSQQVEVRFEGWQSNQSRSLESSS